MLRILIKNCTWSSNDWIMKYSAIFNLNYYRKVNLIINLISTSGQNIDEIVTNFIYRKCVLCKQSFDSIFTRRDARQLTFPVETLRMFWAFDKQVAEFIQKHGVRMTQHVVIAVKFWHIVYFGRQQDFCNI